MNKLWEEVCFILKEIPESSNEALYEQKIIQILEKLGWSSFQKEIILKQSHQLGSNNKIIPDIIVKYLSKNESFVIEVKKPSVDIDNESHKRQLFSYMRQLKLEYGLLIGNKIKIYYDGELKEESDPVLLENIEIHKNNEYGVLFIRLFKKELFSYKNLEEFANEKIKQIYLFKNHEKLYNVLISDNYQDKIQQFIINDLQQNWDTETIKFTLEKLDISVQPIIKKDTLPKINTQAKSIGENNIKIGKLVQENMSTIEALCEKNNEILDNLLDKEYSKSTFGVNYPFMKQTKQDAKKEKHYYKKTIFINKKYYIVTCEWFDRNLPLFQDYLKKNKL